MILRVLQDSIVWSGTLLANRDATSDPDHNFRLDICASCKRRAALSPCRCCNAIASSSNSCLTATLTDKYHSQMPYLKPKSPGSSVREMWSTRSPSRLDQTDMAVSRSEVINPRKSADTLTVWRNDLLTNGLVIRYVRSRWLDFCPANSPNLPPRAPDSPSSLTHQKLYQMCGFVLFRVPLKLYLGVLPVAHGLYCL